ncbi:zinc transporter SLC39A9 [Verticillium alfalfae VaMs.102]|uniref:Zinc transporter SLC39A9 n=1 Tax=Verticillium alfalfae (strain VaMs.102 / ATCC MYA-4576 / FGSC 10136) TaxID=526221 RepID=C9SUW9_VERA1|nr:zinc transporter SLC39A9 [Verticillium alfalfae VaMs.102]EEY22584.1 zinc transporter SLC39A9 [Verticillium alfalfae VaMs.102]
MGGLFLLLVLCAVMAVASFLAGSLPLAVSLTPSQLRLISSLGIGILVGTSMIVIIPEGVEAVVASGVGAHAHAHRTRGLAQGLNRRGELGVRLTSADAVTTFDNDKQVELMDHLRALAANEAQHYRVLPRDGPAEHTHDHDHAETGKGEEHAGEEEGPEVSGFHIGLSMVLGFVLMFLIDRIPRHATEGRTSEPHMRHVSLDNLGANSGGDAEADGFLGGLTQPSKDPRSFATTIGLVIHACADGIPMGAGATTSDTQLGLIIFIAIMLHKAPAAFGLSSVLLKQGLSKRAARTHLIVFSLAAPFGALSTWAIITVLGGGQLEGPSGKWWTGMLLLFSAGTFLYVAMHAMQDGDGGHQHAPAGYAEAGASGQPKPQMRDTLVTVVGMLLPLLTQFGHHHH